MHPPCQPLAPGIHPGTLAAGRTPLALAGLALLLAGCQTTAVPPTSPEVVGEFRAGSGYLKGYLDPKQLPDSLALLPQPAADGSAEQAADLAVHRATRPLRGSPRWDLAAVDNNLKFPKAGETFACTLGMPILAETSPHLTMLLRRSLLDAGLSTYAAKDHYKRLRPFAALKETTCAPQDEAMLSKDGSYPSGHAAVGWAWALILSELAPDRANALLQRGHAFGQSRVVCGVHWQSDVDQGRLVGAAAVARLHADPTFQAQAALARAEIAQARARSAPAPAHCAGEAAALQP